MHMLVHASVQSYWAANQSLTHGHFVCASAVMLAPNTVQGYTTTMKSRLI